jgi:hypothetical protein
LWLLNPGTKKPSYAIVFTVVLAKDTGSAAKGMRESTEDSMDHLYLEEPILHVLAYTGVPVELVFHTQPENLSDYHYVFA